ncbi:coronin, putative [Trichomonas vaginalis G3]|uniref:Coronin n=1 Tax=Trichomonas vaginalis (strain ATCC PRA-98 / G3) TaxID=412133 RepID=A2G0N8_TRIV3|nr:coronin family [Trichomonas vaginalis G3]EAX89278.1 coronin, putative [Trichomonas vaginalis G3]KAI5502785.1 coronin family [Trichomonas vaginalis G3]|eukprot:XP_001302208.1 coronin [Trichomonas vaginalis G3]
MTASPYRHVYAELAKVEKSYQEVNISTTSVDTNLLAANYRYVAYPVETSGGGLFAVLPANGYGKVGTTNSVFRGHTGGVLDVDFNPFNDNIIASAAEDATLRVWQIKFNGTDVEEQNESLAVMKGHSRRVQRLTWNPAVNNCIATFGAEKSVKVWDVSKASCVYTFKAGKYDLLDLNWNQNGNLLVYPMKDKKLHVLDIRANAETFAVNSHPGLRGGRAVFYDKLNMVATTGFSSSSGRQIAVRDIRNPENPLAQIDIDSNNGILAPFIDEDTGILACFSRGDTLIRFYELQSAENPLVTCNAFACKEAVRAFARAPKYCVDTNVCEIDRFYIINQAKQLQTTQVIVPRKNAEIFQEDIYPETNAPVPGIEFDAWKAGGEPKFQKISLENGYTPADGAAFSVEAQAKETVESLKEENEKLRTRIAQLEEELRQLKH